MCLEGKAEKFVSRYEGEGDGCKVWQALNDYYDESSLVAQIELEDTFDMEYKMKEGTDPGQFVLECDEFFERYDKTTGSTTTVEKRIAKAISRMDGKWREEAARRVSRDSKKVEAFAKELTRVYKMGKPSSREEAFVASSTRSRSNAGEPRSRPRICQYSLYLCLMMTLFIQTKVLDSAQSCSLQSLFRCS